MVLGRNLGETIHIGLGVTITVLRFPGHNRVSIGVTAPKEIPINRGEVIGRESDLSQQEHSKFNFPMLLSFIEEHPALKEELEQRGIVKFVPKVKKAVIK